MIEFDNHGMTIHNKLDRTESIVFCKFLIAEKKRLAEDIKTIETSISYLEDKFGFNIEEIIRN
jgi:hypothetical protein